MASSSDEPLDESIPEMVYQCLPLNETIHFNKVSHTKCPLCNEYQFEKSFFCSDCVKSGNFCHSKNKSFERFADKKLKKYTLDKEKADILKRYEEALTKKRELEDVKLSIHSYKEKIQLLQKSINSCKQEVSKDLKQVEDLKEKKAISRKSYQRISEKLSQLQDCKDQKNSILEGCKSELSSHQSRLQAFIQSSINELTTYIFPITKVPSSCYRGTNTTEEGQYAELEEAQKTTYVEGQWVITGSPMDEFQYAVVEPFIPCTGDYSAYTTWCDTHAIDVSRDNLSSLDRHQFDVAYGISAALAYAAQIVRVLSFYLDVQVPKRPSFNDFCRHDNVSKFNYNVAKLNWNIIQLSLARKVDISQLSSQRTISNLLLLINPESKERKRSLTAEEREEILESLEDFLIKDLIPTDESDDDTEAEFVHVSDEEIIPVPEEAQPIPPSFVSSVYSLWKVATGQK